MTQSRALARLLLIVGAALVALGLSASAAFAAETGPGYEKFAGCPTPEEDPKIEICLFTEVNGGHFQMGTKDVPLDNPVRISGGISTEGFSFNSEGGLEPVRQQVPGGIIGLTGLDWLVEFLDIEELKLYAVTELAGTPGNPLADPFQLPIKIHLENAALGEECFVGSDSNPIMLNLTEGTTEPPPPNEPISGQEPTLGFSLEPVFITLSDGILVDNAFSAPKSNGCELDLGFIKIGIDTLVSEVSGLPAAAGTNETVQEFDGGIAAPALVYP